MLTIFLFTQYFQIYITSKWSLTFEIVNVSFTSMTHAKQIHICSSFSEDKQNSYK